MAKGQFRLADKVVQPGMEGFSVTDRDLGCAARQAVRTSLTLRQISTRAASHLSWAVEMREDVGSRE
jgi:hypothetical protein